MAALPAEMLGFQRTGGIVDLEQQAATAGFGASARYVPANGEKIRATVYVCDRGRRQAPEGMGPAGLRELENAAAEVKLAAKLGQYRSAAFDKPVMVQAAGQGKPPEAACLTLRLLQLDGAATADSVCVTVQRGYFVKVRLTAWNDVPPPVAGAAALSLLNAVMDSRRAVSL